MFQRAYIRCILENNLVELRSSFGKPKTDRFHYLGRESPQEGLEEPIGRTLLVFETRGKTICLAALNPTKTENSGERIVHVSIFQRVLAQDECFISTDFQAAQCAFHR